MNLFNDPPFKRQKIGPFNVVFTDLCPPGQMVMVPDLEPEPWETREAYLRRVAKHSVRIRFEEDP